jgi:hypothetical protein
MELACGRVHTILCVDKNVFDVGVVLDFGAMWFCRLVPTFQRSVLSPSSGLKWQSWGLEVAYIRFEEGRLRERANQREGIWEKGSGAAWSLQAGYTEGGWVRSELREESCSCSEPVLVPSGCELRGFHDLREKPFFLLMLLRCSSISISSPDDLVHATWCGQNTGVV